MDDSIASKDLKDDSALFACFCISVGSFAIEGATALVIVFRSIPGEWLFLTHMTICALIFLYCLKLYKAKCDIRFGALFFIIFLVTGGFGSIIFVIIVLHYLFYIKSSSTFAEWFASLFPEESSSKSDKLYERIMYGLDEIDDSTTEPFRNILTYGTLQQKQLVISKITKHFSPNLADALLRAINDPEAAIRVQAATAVAKIEHNFVEKYIELEKELKKKPNDLVLMLKLAKFCDSYANSKILDKEREDESRHKAIEMYKKCIKIKPKGDNIRRSLGRLYEQSGQFDMAYKWLKQCVDEEGITSPELIMTYMETLFHRGDYKRIRQLTKKYSNNFEKDTPLYRRASELLDLWNNGIEEEKLILKVHNV